MSNNTDKQTNPNAKQKQGSNTRTNKGGGQQGGGKSAKTTPRPKRQQKGPARRPKKRPAKADPKLKIIPLGGLGEIGKNLTYYECEGEALLVDCGMAFPDESLPGIDLVIPDFTFLVENKDKIKGLCITHGHEDHIGSIPYLLKEINLPIYGTRLTMGLIEGKLKEHGLLNNASLNIVKPGQKVKLGKMTAEFIHVNHSIPDACSIAVHTPAGVVVQTGDFKVDYTPIDGDVINLARFGQLGSYGVLALLSDSTNAELPGNTSSERIVGGSLDKLFMESDDKRIIVATFASNVHRIQQILDAAHNHNRKVAISGRSMENVTEKALEMGYLKTAKDTIIDVKEADNLPPEKVVVITTGSQGEPMSALTRMARGDHRNVNVTSHDRIIISANPIPGNEKLVNRVINDLFKLGADVVYEKMYDIHVSGHARQDELKLMMALTKPKYFVPVHGEYKQLKRHSELAQSMGIKEENIMLAQNGQTIEFDSKGMKAGATVPAGRVLVDGLGVGDVGNIVLRDRMHLSEYGLIVVIATIKRSNGEIVAGPDIVSRGFVYVRESETMLSKARDIAEKSIQASIKEKNGTIDWGSIKSKVRDDVGDYVWQTTKRRPMILPVIQEVD